MARHLIEDGMNPEGLAAALEHIGVPMRFNVRSDRCEVWHGGSWLKANDRNMMRLKFQIEAACEVPGAKAPKPMAFGKDAFYQCRDALLADREVDPFRDWLDALEPLALDSGDVEDYGLRIDNVFVDLFDAPSDPYRRHVSRMIPLTAVWRAFEPGCKCDEIAVLQGPQGAGKDSVIKALVPESSQFTDALGFNMSDKEKIELTRGKVFVCASEMGGVTTTRDLEALKRWITTTEDACRLSYRRDAEDMPRRFVVVGTTNADKPLPPDATGNRRWCVIPIPKGAHVEPWIEERRIDLWREAVALYRLGVRPNLPRDMMPFQETENRMLKRSDDQFEDALTTAIAEGKVGHEPMQLGQVAWNLGIVDGINEWTRASKQDQHRLRDVLIGRGWRCVRARYEGMARQWWLPRGVDLPEMDVHKGDTG